MRPAEICADALFRRGFLRLGVAGAVMTVADWRLWAADEGLPAYYGEHLAKVAARLRALSKSCDDAFFFITDLHIPDNRCVSGRILAKLVAETDVKCVFQIAADRLPAAECEVSVTPVNSLGKVGAALKG